MTLLRFASCGRSALPFAALVVLGAACTPTVKLEAPQDPIVINLNVKIEQEVRIKVDRELDQAITENKDLF